MFKLSEIERKELKSKIQGLLETYDFAYNSYGVNKIIDTWEQEKGDLIELLMKHPNYMEGKYMIAFDADFTRENDPEKVRLFQQYLTQICEKPERIEALPDVVKERMKEDDTEFLPINLYNLISYLPINQFLIEEEAAYINAAYPGANFRAGQKTTRVINKVLTWLGYDKDPEYNREFAKYADAMNPLTIKRHTILSVNPLDYLTMSFGNSWASCHTIDKYNTRGMPNGYSGQYCSGTLSYMMDPSSMVFYTVEASYDGDEYYTQPKVNRQMFHYANSKLIQGRLYPQDNDGNAEGYTPFRYIVQEIMSVVLGEPNFWSLHKGTEAASRWAESLGTHYRDYEYYANCNRSDLREDLDNDGYVTIGHDPICPLCGAAHDYSENLLCEECANEGYFCSDCGEWVSDNDVCLIDGEAYCRNCVEYCEDCDEYYRGGGVWVEGERRYVCEDCFNEYYSMCEECDEYYANDEVHYIESENRYVCEDCLRDNYIRCDECGEYVRKDSAFHVDGKHICEFCNNEKGGN